LVNHISLWPGNPDARPNYTDDQNNYSGTPGQCVVFDGNWGVCGDGYNDTQDNENTGTYGRDIFAREYTFNRVIGVNFFFTNNHMGYFDMRLEVLKDANVPESGKDCF
jgi:hypothetical protein